MTSLETKQQQGLPKQATDEDVVRQVCAGDVALFEVLMRRNNGRLYRAIRSFISDETEVEDLMQQTYVLAYSRLGQFAHGARFSTWLIRIGINEALQKLRQRRRWQVVNGGNLEQEGDAMTSTPTDRPSTPEDQAGAREAVRLVELLISEMPDLYRAVFMLREVEGLSTAETAEALGITEDTVKQRLFRARQHLKEGMEARTGQSLEEVFPFHAHRCDRIVAATLRRIAELGAPLLRAREDG